MRERERERERDRQTDRERDIQIDRRTGMRAPTCVITSSAVLEHGALKTV